MAREPDQAPSEISERMFRQSDDYRHLAAVKAEQRRQVRAELRARWPLRRIAGLALVYGVPLALLVGWYWAGKALNLVGGG